jgi:hypothetical protein
MPDNEIVWAEVLSKKDSSLSISLSLRRAGLPLYKLKE